MATTETTSLSMDLTIDAANQKVLFAEASRDVVDYLHSLLRGMPDAFAENATVDGCVENIPDAVEDLDAAELDIRARLSSAKRFFECGYRRGAGCAGYVAEARGARCPSCGWEMAAEVPRDSPGAGCSGEVVACLINDNLSVRPVAASRLEHARRMALMGVVTSTELETRTVPLGYTEGLAILEASLQSDTVLTDVFLGNKDFPSCKRSKLGD